MNGQTDFNILSDAKILDLISKSTLNSLADLPERKIFSALELTTIIQLLKDFGKKVVLAHGVFDLFHLGHLKHLQEARSVGDVLVVSLTADGYVNKGIGRPIFNQNQRAEMLAGLSCVDYVVVNNAPTAIEMLNMLRPNVYVKGNEYAKVENDITGKIVDERNAVENIGAKVYFTDDITFSSSNLINNYLGVFEPKLQAYLDGFKKNYSFKEIETYIHKLSDLKVLFIGETIIDEYMYVQPMGKTPKENVIASIHKDREAFAGGVIAAAKHAANFCQQVDVLTVGGNDWDSFEIEKSLPDNLKVSLVHDNTRPTIRKTRYIDKSFFSKLYEVYHMDDSPLDAHQDDTLLNALSDRIKKYDLVVVTDFGHGMISQTTRDFLIENAKFLAVNAQSNSGNMGYNLISNYPKADYFCIDAPEARLAARDKRSELPDIANLLYHHHIKCPKFIITHGRYGSYGFDMMENQQVHEAPVFTTKVLDTLGAGDAFLALTAPLVAINAPLRIVSHIGNAVGAIKVNILGHKSSVDKIQLLKFLNTLSK